MTLKDYYQYRKLNRKADRQIDEKNRRIKELEDLNRLKDIDIKALEERNDRLNDMIELDMKEIAKLKKELEQLSFISSTGTYKQEGGQSKEWFLKLIDKTIEVTQSIDENDFEAVADVYSERFAKAMRVKGWIHKDDPVKGLKVIETCPDWDYTRGICDVPKSERDCNCTDGKISTSLTVGEALEIIDRMVEELHDVLWNISINEVSCKMSVTKALTTKDGRKVVKEG